MGFHAVISRFHACEHVETKLFSFGVFVVVVVVVFVVVVVVFVKAQLMTSYFDQIKQPHG